MIALIRKSKFSFISRFEFSNFSEMPHNDKVLRKLNIYFHSFQIAWRDLNINVPITAAAKDITAAEDILTFFFYVFRENKALHYMQIIHLAMHIKCQLKSCLL